MRPPLLFIHGAFCGGWAFDGFRARLAAAGFEGHAPDLRGHVANVSMSDYAADIAKLAGALAAPPIIVGHSLGGLIAQLVAQKVKVAGLVLLAPSAPWGVTGVSMEEAGSAFGLYTLGPFWTQAISPDRTMARLYSLDRMEPDMRGALMSRMTPESGRALFETLNWWLDPFMTTRVDPARIAVPVLVASGGADQIHPPSTVRQTAERLGGDLQVFPEMSHWLVGEEGWEGVADACIAWLNLRFQSPAKTKTARR
jgi:pimeloyl-ACP methyl ester carboxylesterase